jgi:hypothetical protein
LSKNNIFIDSNRPFAYILKNHVCGCKTFLRNMRYIMAIRKLAWLLPVVLLTGLFWNCDKSDGGEEFNNDVDNGNNGGGKGPSSTNAITAFSFDSIDPPAVGTINGAERSVTVRVGFGTDLTSLSPTITISTGASIDPASGVARNFGGNAPLKYTVTAVDGAVAEWAVTVKFKALTSIEDVKTYLGAVAGGADAGAPVPLPVSIKLSGIGENGWRALLAAIQGAGKYVNLDISDCKMTGKTFDPIKDMVNGKNLIVSLVLPDAAASIPDGGSRSAHGGLETYDTTFNNFSSLKHVSGKNIKTIGSYAFFCDDTLKFLPAAISTVDFPNVTDIGWRAFGGLHALTTVSLPKAASIGAEAFVSCKALVTLELPSAASIGQAAFGLCKALTTLNLPAVTTIRNDAFWYTGAGTLTLNLPDTAPTLSLGNKDAAISFSEEYSKSVIIKRSADSTGYDAAWQETFRTEMFGDSKPGTFRTTVTLKFEDL